MQIRNTETGSKVPEEHIKQFSIDITIVQTTENLEPDFGPNRPTTQYSASHIKFYISNRTKNVCHMFSFHQHPRSLGSIFAIRHLYVPQEQ